MVINNITEIYTIEQKYDDLRWSSDQAFQTFSLDHIRKYRTELNEIITELSRWINSLDINNNDRKRILIVKKKLIDFQWHLVKEEQNRDRIKRHFERVDTIIESEPSEISSGHKNFGLHSPLKGSDFYKDIPAIYGPQPRQGGR